MTELYSYRDYQSYLNDWLGAQAGEGRGQRALLARKLGCHIGYVSRVLSEKAHLSLEQAALCSEYLGLRDQETEYFILLVQRARAGNASLRTYLDRQIRTLLDLRREAQKKRGVQITLSPEAQSRYYSAWYYAAVHIVLSIPSLQTVDSISRYYRLPTSTVEDVLRFLCSVGLAQCRGKVYRIGHNSIHADSQSNWIVQHHLNWRLQAMQSISARLPRSLHYSSVIGIAEADAERVQDILLQAIESVRTVVQESKEDGAYFYNLDFGRVPALADARGR